MVNIVACRLSSVRVCQSCLEPPTAMRPATVCGFSFTTPMDSRKLSSYARKRCAKRV